MKRIALGLFVLSLVQCANSEPDYVAPAGFTPEDTQQLAGGPRAFVADGERVLTGTLADRLLRRRAEGKADDDPSVEPVDDGLLEVSMGANYQDGMRVSTSRRPRAHLEFRPLGASSSAGKLRGDGAIVAYENAYPGVTAAFGGTNRKVKEFLRVPEAGMAPELRYEVIKGPEFGNLKAGVSGELWAYDIDGGPLFAVLPPMVKDAMGKQIDGAWEILEDAGKMLVRAALSYEGLTYPLMIDPSFDSPRWFFDDDNEPPARGAMAAAWFNTQQMAVIFGGVNGSGTYLGDTRVKRVQTNSHVWRDIDVAATSPAKPTARAYAALAPRDSESAGYLFGGHDTTGKPSDELWRLVLTSGTNFSVTGVWTQITPPSPKTSTNWPSPRFLHGMAALDNNNILLFGGVDSTGALLKDTWQWNGSAWTRLCDSCFPGLYGFATVPGRARENPRDAPVVFAGYDGAGMTNGVFQWNNAGSTWNSVAIGDASIPTNDSGTVASSATVGTVSPDLRYLGYGFHTPSGSVVLGGGLTSSSSNDTYFNDLWEWSSPGQTDGDFWVRQPSRQSLASPGPRESPAAIFFETSSTSQVAPFGLLFGGITNASTGTVIRQTRIYRPFADGVTLAIQVFQSTEYRLRATIDFGQLNDATRIQGYFVRQVATAGGSVWEPVPGCGSPSAPLSGSGSTMRITCSSLLSANPNTIAFGVLVRDRAFYTQANGNNGTQCNAATSNESVALCGLATAFPGQATCGTSGAGNGFSCPASP